MIRSFSGKRFLNVGSVDFGRSFKYERPETQRAIDKGNVTLDQSENLEPIVNTVVKFH